MHQCSILLLLLLKVEQVCLGTRRSHDQCGGCEILKETINGVGKKKNSHATKIRMHFLKFVLWILILDIWALKITSVKPSEKCRVEISH